MLNEITLFVTLSFYPFSLITSSSCDLFGFLQLSSVVSCTQVRAISTGHHGDAEHISDLEVWLL